ncbi:hypothetical protein JHK82_046014 [Glycine max]|nr:hypothetical protein JHK85_044945 [Glycine max]KAG5100962.1 hypothetical protein JHK82_046014 [Glycine max]
MSNTSLVMLARVENRPESSFYQFKASKSSIFNILQYISNSDVPEAVGEIANARVCTSSNLLPMENQVLKQWNRTFWWDPYPSHAMVAPPTFTPPHPPPGPVLLAGGRHSSWPPGRPRPSTAARTTTPFLASPALPPPSKSNALISSSPARLTRQHTRLTTVAPIEEEKEEEHIFNDGEQEMRKKLEVEIVILFKESLYHPDVSKDPQAAELFKSIHDAYKVLSNEAARVQYDQELQFGHKPYREKWSYGPEFEDQARFYSETDEEEDEVVDLDEERGSLVEVLRSAFVSLFLLQTPGSRFSLTFSSLTALFDKKLDTGYKMGYIITWILGGRGGILLTLCLLVASWVCGKTVVAFVVVAIWVGSYLARYAPLPQGALLALLYMSIKLQSDLI